MAAPVAFEDLLCPVESHLLSTDAIVEAVFEAVFGLGVVFGPVLLVVELLLPDGAAPDGRLRPAIQTDLFMLVNFADSRERSLDEYERLLGDCGFALEQAIALPSSFSVLDFRPH